MEEIAVETYLDATLIGISCTPITYTYTYTYTLFFRAGKRNDTDETCTAPHSIRKTQPSCAGMPKQTPKQTNQNRELVRMRKFAMRRILSMSSDSNRVCVRACASACMNACTHAHTHYVGIVCFRHREFRFLIHTAEILLCIFPGSFDRV
jgi:hypothetical protein